MIDAINEWRTLKGIKIDKKRIAKSHPYPSKGIDPNPKKEKVKEKE